MKEQLQQQGQRSQAAPARGRVRKAKARWSHTCKRFGVEEAMEADDCLFLFAVHDPKDYHQPREQPFLPSNRAALCCVRNGAPVRLPTCSAGGVVSGGEHTRHDIAQAFARLETGKYKQLIVSQELSELMDRRRFGTALSEPMDQLLSYHALPQPREEPQFMEGHTHRRLLRDHHQRIPTPKRGLRVLSILSGVSGEGLALRALQKRTGEKLIFVECCPEARAQLKKRFPNARIIPGDINDPEVQREIYKLRGQVDVVILAVPCQPSSFVNSDRDPKDPRIAVGDLALELALRLGARLVILEDVIGFRTHQREAYDRAVAAMEKQYDVVEEIDLDGRHCLLPQPRNRLFLVATDQVDLTSTKAMAAEQRRLGKGGKLKDSKSPRGRQVRTCPTVRQRLRVAFPHMSLRSKRGIYLPSLKGAPKGKVTCCVMASKY